MSPLDTEPQAGAVGWERSEPLPPPTPGRTSTRPAMVVLGLAVVIVATFVTLGLVSSHPAPSLHSGSRSSAVPGSTLRAEAATTVLTPILTPGQPPINVVNAVVVPVGVVREGHRDDSAGSGQFDAQVAVRSDASQAALLAFFASEMPRQGWRIFDRGPAAHDPGATEILGRLAGSDGYYWQMGAIVDATTFPPGGPPRGETDFTVRLLQQSDDVG